MAPTEVLDANGTFDWLLSYRTHGALRSLLDTALQRYISPSILVVGCGRSTLSEDLHDAGYPCVTSVDISASCIHFMRQRTRAKPALSWAVVDLAEQDALGKFGAFDVVIDKSTLDAVVCAGDHEACAMVWNVAQVLKPTGVYIVVSCHEGRRVGRFLAPAMLGLDVDSVDIAVPSCFNGKAFVCRKKEKVGTCRGGFEAYCAEVEALEREEEREIAEVLRRKVERGFEGRLEQKMEAEEVYEMVFSQQEQREYGIQDFHSDLRCFNNGVSLQELTQQQTLAFLKAMG